MATSILDAPLPTRAVPRAARWPAAVLLLAAVSGLEAVALLAGGLTGLDGLVTAPRPSGALVAAVLGGLAGWVVLCAGGGLAVVDGSGRRLATGVAFAEVVLVLVLAVAGPRTLPAGDLPTTLPLPALALLALAVPVGKLLLLTAPTTRAWAAAAPPRGRPAPVAHPRVRLVTVALIGVALGALALGAPAGGERPSTAAVSGR
ncbi:MULTISPECIES: hypothetical protein [unclassified Geodermatophilus]